MTRLLWLVIFCFLLDSAYCSPRIDGILSGHKSRQLGLYSIDLGTGQVIASKGARAPLIPASVQKVAVSGAALRYLGPEHRFTTVMSYSGRSGVTIDHLYIKGGGDPGFTIESLFLMVRELRKRGIRSIKAVTLDDSLFDSSVSRVGGRAYEAGASALTFNYNSIGVTVCPSTVGTSATVAIDPWEAGIELVGTVRTVKGGKAAQLALDELPMKSAESKQRFVIKGEIPVISACRTIYRSVEDTVRYLGQTFLGLSREAGITVPHQVTVGITPRSAQELYAHRSTSLVKTLRDLNHYSNNIIAEQIVYGLAENRTDGRRYREDGLRRVASYLESLGIPAEERMVADGSGLSRDNRLSAHAVVQILSDLWSDPRVRPEFEASLSRLGESGTLEKRRNGRREIFVRGKTGSLTGVSSLAGYLVTQKGRVIAFAMIQNGAEDRDSALKFEEKVLEALYDDGQ